MHNAGLCNYSLDSEREVRELDEFALEKLQVITGLRIRWSNLKDRIAEFIDEWKAFACKGCESRCVCDA